MMLLPKAPPLSHHISSFSSLGARPTCCSVCSSPAPPLPTLQTPISGFPLGEALADLEHGPITALPTRHPSQLCFGVPTAAPTHVSASLTNCHLRKARTALAVVKLTTGVQQTLIKVTERGPRPQNLLVSSRKTPKGPTKGSEELPLRPRKLFPHRLCVNLGLVTAPGLRGSVPHFIAQEAQAQSGGTPRPTGEDRPTGSVASLCRWPSCADSATPWG